MPALQTFSPPPDLAAVVKKISVITEDDASQAANSMSYYADGLPGLMFHHSLRDVVLKGKEQKLPTLFLYGQTVKPITIMTAGPFRAIIVHFFPHVVKTLFGVNAHELTDSCIDHKLLELRASAEIECRLHNEIDVSGQLSMIADFLRPLATGVQGFRNADIRLASQKLFLSSGEVSLKSLQKELHVSERSFERKFLQHVGVTPTLFRRICKFSSVLVELESRRFTSLTDLAYQQGFADQSHFIRTFKEFTGVTPRKFLLKFA